MNTALRLLLALTVAFAVAACRKDTQEETPAETTPADTTAPVTTDAAPDPRDYSDARNFDNPESLLSKRVVYFDFDKSDLRQDARNTLTKNAEIMLKSKQSAKIKIEGHCDERGSAEYNIALGERRATSAMQYLITLGVQSDRLSIISYGKEKPAVQGSGEEAWAKNRRAEFVIDK